MEENKRERYGRLYEEYRIELKHYIRRKIHDENEVEDIINDVFYTIMYKDFDLDDIQNLKSWLYNFATKKIMNANRKSDKIILNYDMDENNWIADIDVETQVLYNIYKEKLLNINLKEALKQYLTEKEWKLFKERFLSSTPIRKIATDMNLSEVNIKVRIHRLRIKSIKYLRKLINNL